MTKVRALLCGGLHDPIYPAEILLISLVSKATIIRITGGSDCHEPDSLGISVCLRKVRRHASSQAVELPPNCHRDFSRQRMCPASPCLLQDVCTNGTTEEGTTAVQRNDTTQQPTSLRRWVFRFVPPFLHIVIQHHDLHLSISHLCPRSILWSVPTASRRV